MSDDVIPVADGLRLEEDGGRSVSDDVVPVTEGVEYSARPASDGNTLAASERSGNSLKRFQDLFL